ncbi:hypothetical protein JCM10207_000257 [Rhodosporidiobolus poonsookiae]
MARRFFGSGPARLSGAQPTFTSLGKAKGSKKGNRRAKAGGRVSRRDAFPKAGGRALGGESSDDDDEDEEGEEDEDEEELPKRATRKSASSAVGTNLRASAAARRAKQSGSHDLDLDLDLDDNVSDVSSHASEDSADADSDDPDRETGRDRKKTRQAQKAQERRDGAYAVDAAQARHRAPDAQNGGGGAAAQLRRLRAEAAERRLQAALKPSNTIVIADSSDDEPQPQPKPSPDADGPSSPRTSQVQLYRAPPPPQTLRGLRTQQKKERAAAKRALKRAEEGLPPARPRGKKKTLKDMKGGRRLDGEGMSEGDDEALEQLEAFKRRQRVVGGEEGGGKGKGKGKGKAKEALFRSDDDESSGVEQDDSDDNLRDPSAALSAPRAPRASTSASASTSKRRRSTSSTSASGTRAGPSSRALKRARTSGRALDEFQGTDDESEAGEEGAVVVETGGGRVKLHGAARGKGTGKGKGRARTPKEDEDAAEEEEEEDEPDYSHLGIPAFVDPRRDLARRQMREWTDPPTDAFSSSDGEGDGSGDEAPRAKKGSKGKGKKEGERAEMEKMDRHMAEKKRTFREERGPGYSNPRRN